MKAKLLIMLGCIWGAGVWAQQPVADFTPLAADETARLVKAVADSVEAGYVFPEKGKAMKTFLLERLRKKAYAKLSLPQLADALRADLLSVCADKHVAVRLHRGGPGSPQPGPFESSLQPFTELRILEGNIGYLRFDRFPEEEPAMNGALGAMLLLANTDALVFDMRYNGGGGMMLIQLLSGMLLEHETHLNNVYYRMETDTFKSYTAVPEMDYRVFFKRPMGQGTDTATVVPDFGKLKRIPVYILTSDYTFSAAEEFTYNLQSLKRAVVVGDTTGGGAHPVRRLTVLNKFSLWLPFARSINPITGTNWEGVGVRPDIVTESEKALQTAHIHALRALAESKPAHTGLSWQLARVMNTYNPYTATEKELVTYVGSYEDRSIRLENGKLVSQRAGQRPFVLTPIGPGLFELDAQLRLRFVSLNGTIQKVEMLNKEGVVGQQMKGESGSK